jgi:hypothetical protein
MEFLPKIDISKEKITQHFGYSSSPPKKLEKATEEMLNRAKDLFSPRGVYVLRRIIHFPEKVVLIPDRITFNTVRISHYLTCCDEIAVYLVTIGDDLEEEVSKLMVKGDFLSGLILDAIGSEATERAADCLQELIKSSQKERRGVTPLRFGPGYCDWRLSDQSSIFKAINSLSLNLGVKLTKNYMMIPRKSTSGIIGVGDAENIMSQPTPCQLCTKKDYCSDRR